MNTNLANNTSNPDIKIPVSTPPNRTLLNRISANLPQKMIALVCSLILFIVVLSDRNMSASFEKLPVEITLPEGYDTVESLNDITVDVKSEDDWIVFSVADTGIGIASSEQKNIFNDFYRVGDEMTRSTKGSGLGLATVKRVAETHKATISLVSKPGKGSTFTVKFKRAE